MDDLPRIDDERDPAVRRLRDLNKPSRGTVRTVLLEDEEPVTAALDAGVEIAEVYVADAGEAPRTLLARCARDGVPCRAVATAVVNELFRGDRKPKVFAVGKVPPPARLGQVLARPGDVVVLDGVRIVGNVGAIVRTALGLGAAGIVLVDSDLTTIADRRLIRASRGYVFALPVVLADGEDAAAALHGAGVSITVLDAEGDTDVAALAARDGRTALVLGGEKRGSTGPFGRLADARVSIPMAGPVESLNVSVTAGIVLHARAVAR